MKDLNYGKDYQYAYAFDGNFVNMEFLPDAISGLRLYEPGNNAREEEMRSFWKDFGRRSMDIDRFSKQIALSEGYRNEFTYWHTKSSYWPVDDYQWQGVLNKPF